MNIQASKFNLNDYVEPVHAPKSNIKVRGGSFGITGSAHIRKDGHLIIENDAIHAYASEDIKSATARTKKTSSFNLLNFVFFSILWSIIFGLFLSVIGVFIGVAIAYSYAKNSSIKYYVEMAFTDGKSITVQCKKTDVQALIDLANG